MRRLKTRAQFQALMGTAPLAKTSRFVLYRLPVVASTGGQESDQLSPAAVAATAVSDPKLRVADFTQARLMLEALLPCATLASVRAGVREATWLAALVPKRWAKRAVTRNLVRRQIAAVLFDTLSRPGNRLFTPEAPSASAGVEGLMFAYLVRMRASFHAPVSGGQRGKNKGKAGRGQTVRAVDAPVAPAWRSAASDGLKVQVRQELLLLCGRAEAALAAGHSVSVGRRPPPPAVRTAEVSV